MQQYRLIFNDSLINNTIFSTDQEFAISSVKLFGQYNNYLAIIFAISGFFIAVNINYLFGITIAKILTKAKMSVDNLHIKLSQNLTKYSLFFCALTILPFAGKFICIFLGLYNVKWSKIIIPISALRLCYYIYIMLN